MPVVMHPVERVRLRAEAERKMRNQAVSDSVANVLHRLHDTRDRLGLIEMEEGAAQRRMVALDQLDARTFVWLLAQPEEHRENVILALEAGQRRRHVLASCGAMARSEFDDRILFRWECGCGEQATGDYFSATDARDAWALHAGVTNRTASIRSRAGRACDGCGKEHYGNGRYCSRACRERHQVVD